MTFSRSAWLALVFVGITWIILNIKSFKFTAYCLQLTAFTIILITILTTIYFPIIQTRFSTAPRLEQQAIEQRLTGFKQAKALFIQNPILGVGIGNYTVVLKNQFPDLQDYKLQPVHNIYLLILSELGIFGLILFLFLILKIFNLFFEIRNSKFEIPESYNITLILILISFLIIGFLDHYFWTLPSTFYLFWLVVALIVNFNNLTN